MIVSVLLVVWAGVIAWYDIRQRRVPNPALVLVLIPSLLAVCIQRQGLLGQGVWSSVGGMVLVFAVTLPGYLLKRFGAGDVKFAALLGLLLGLARGFELLIMASLLMGAMAVVLSLRALPKSAKFPAAPMLAAAFAVEMYWGPLLLR
jgi:prepilin peptidase CpaA